MEVAPVLLPSPGAAQPARLRPLVADSDLPAAKALLAAALPWDQAGPVVEEKLFAGNGQRSGQTLGAFAGDELVGLLAQAGRWLKLLLVHPAARRRGIGTQLLLSAQAFATTLPADPVVLTGRPRLRVGDHPGNYLSPGIDERELAGQAFLRARGFVEIGRNLNLRAPVVDNPLLSPERIAERIAKAATQGYAVRRVTAEDIPALLQMVTTDFHRVWAYEVSRALGPALGGAAALHTKTLPEGASVHIAVAADGAVVAFAAHDGNNRGLGWFGPTGTLPSHRGRGLGEALLLCCLADVAPGAASAASSPVLQAAARPDAGVIAWVGPVEYYARACGAVPDRCFVVYEEAP